VGKYEECCAEEDSEFGEVTKRMEKKKTVIGVSR
jgi:hypothetical protein